MILRVFGTDVAVDTLPGEAILTALTRTGYSYKFGCKRGGCGICTLGLVEGEVEYPVTVAQSVLPDEERDSTVLSCRAVPVSDTHRQRWLDAPPPETITLDTLRRS